MAILSKIIAQFDEGRCTWSYEYEDGSTGSPRILTRVTCTNNSSAPTRGTVTVMSNGRTFTRLVAAGGTFDQALPTTLGTRFDITIDQFGRVDGIDHRFQWGPDVV